MFPVNSSFAFITRISYFFSPLQHIRRDRAQRLWATVTRKGFLLTVYTAYCTRIYIIYIVYTSYSYINKIFIHFVSTRITQKLSKIFHTIIFRYSNCFWNVHNFNARTKYIRGKLSGCTVTRWKFMLSFGNTRLPAVNPTMCLKLRFWNRP